MAPGGRRAGQETPQAERPSATGVVQAVLIEFSVDAGLLAHDLLDLRPPLRLADLPALEILAARVLDIPLRLRASYLLLFLIDLPAIDSAPVFADRQINRALAKG